MTDRELDAIADRVADRLASRVADEVASRLIEELRGSGLDCARGDGRLVDAAELARMLGVERDWIYAHAREFGAIRLGGPQGRLRFDPEKARAALSSDAPPAPVPSKAEPRRRSRRRRSDIPLLEVKGRTC